MPAGVHYVDLATVRRAKSTLGTYSVHFVHFANETAAKWTKCTLAAANLPTLPTKPPLTFAGATSRTELGADPSEEGWSQPWG